MTRLQGSLHATARVLAPSKEAFDTPLSPPPLNGEPGPATGRSGAYPDGTSTRRPGPASRTQHAVKVVLTMPRVKETLTPVSAHWLLWAWPGHGWRLAMS